MGSTLDPRRGVHLRALLARDRRPGGPGTDRLALVAHELAVDAASWRTLLDDLTTALATTTTTAPPAAPDPIPDTTPTPAPGSDDASAAPAPAPAPTAPAPTAPALAPAAAGPSPAWRAPGTPDGWVALLRELADDPAEARHWAQVAESRSHAAATGPATAAGPVTETAPAPPGTPASPSTRTTPTASPGCSPRGSGSVPSSS
ncbi:hypothetical protein [Streptomyces galbus]|uniref:hypothetical protein n=1 Tax=Streptomyces galbus TaxID=33898 RepID=UPI003EB8CC76